MTHPDILIYLRYATETLASALCPQEQQNVNRQQLPREKKTVAREGELLPEEQGLDHKFQAVLASHSGAIPRESAFYVIKKGITSF